MNAHWSNYGRYIQKLIETVQTQWGKQIAATHAEVPKGSVVHVKFIVDSAGEVTTIISVEGGNAGLQAERMCVAGITAASPFGVWSGEMVSLLGDAGHRSAVVYSIVVSCQRRGIEPMAYLRDVLSRLPGMTTKDDITALTPANWAKTKATAALAA